MRFRRIRLVKINTDSNGNDFFYFDGQRKYLSDFIRCHNNPWISDIYPPYIQAIEADNYVNPICLNFKDDEKILVYMAEVA